VIVSFKSSVLEQLWIEGDVTLLPSTYTYEVIDILTILDASERITDVELLGGFNIDEYKTNNWAVTVTVNNVEPVGSITCLFSNGNAHDVDLNEYN
tara:strand:+ start:16101 stop:16388 length:288 start_codon:yes stop_codon:yes gene_type:complete